MPLTCVRIPADLDEQFRMQCDAVGMNASEAIRLLITQWIGGQAPTVEEGYAEARSIAAQLAHAVVTRALQELPETAEEAVRYIHEMNAAAQAIGVANRG